MYLSLILDAAQPNKIRDLADAVSVPQHTDYGKYCDRSELSKLVAITGAERQELEAWFTGYGMQPVSLASLDDQQMLLCATPEQLGAALGESAVQKLRSRKSQRTFLARSVLPRRLAGYVQSIQILPDKEWSATVPKQFSPLARNDNSSGEISLPDGIFGATPGDIRRTYQFPETWDGSGETIAVMALGGYPHPEDLHRFWHTFNIQPPSVYSVQVGAMGARAQHPLYQWETTMAVQWIGAMAPGARIVIYFIDPEYFADPWATFLLAVLSDRHFQPTIACTTWSTPERQYYRVHGSEVIASLLDRVAALGITFIAGSGDWGVSDGLPQRQFNGQRVCDAPWPHGVFPAVEEKVLAVGGTVINWEPCIETAWSAPVSPALKQALQIERMASSGGFSEHIPIPQWQQAVLKPYYPRSGETPAVIPYGRGFPDVALMAWGTDANNHTAAYWSLIANQWRNDAGGTSLAAPLWSAIIACLNQARRSHSLPRLGFINPLLYSLCLEKPSILREITAGNTDMIVQAIAATGTVTSFTLPGFTASPGWNPLTGLGVPNVMDLLKYTISCRVRQ